MVKLRMALTQSDPTACSGALRRQTGAVRVRPARLGSVPCVIGRIVICDVEPVVACGQRPAKAVAGETFEVSATVFREGHESLGAGVVLRGPDGQRLSMSHMREIIPGTDRYVTEVTPSSEGRWRFQVEA